HLAFPPGVRADTGVRTGDAISPWYDPMIAKVIVHGPTRAIALSRLARALDDTQVAGTVTNLAFLGALARHPGFVAGDVDTGLIARDLPMLTAAAQGDALDRAMLGTAVLAAARLPAGPLAGFALWSPLRHPVLLRRGDAAVPALVTLDGPDRALIAVEGEALQAARTPAGWSVAGRAPLAVIEAQGAIHVCGPGRTLSVTRADPLDRAVEAGGGGGITRSPMPGLVKAVFVAAGQAVAAGDRLAVLEAMKMEHVLTAARDGTVAEVLVEAGAQVEAGAALIRLDEDAA
ncbi:MAG: biotin/lipoyl-containing protein, partial [Gemmobacter sp.]